MAFKNTLLINILKFLGHRSLKTLNALAYLAYLITLPLPLQLKRTIRINISRCFPNLSMHEINSLVKKNVLQTFIRILEMPFFWFAPIKKINTLQWDIQGETEFKKIFEEGRGVILLVPHLGAWEAVNYYMGSHYSAASLYKPGRHHYQELLLKIARERFGTQMFPTNVSGIKGLLQSLKAGRCAAILPDHDPGENGGIFVPFFDIPAHTATLIAKLASKSTAPIYCVVSSRLSKGKGFRLEFIPGRALLKNPDLETAVTAMNDQIASLIKRWPEQYEWSYKRFRRTRWNQVWFYETIARQFTSSRAIGLIGGIASGKSLAAQFFHEHGIEVIDTDTLSHELTRKGSTILTQIVTHFGPEVLTDNNELDRARLKTIIFQDPQERLWLEALLHPAIRVRARQRVMCSRTPYCVVAIPLLKRREDYAFLNEIVFIDNHRPEQIKRLQARDHISLDIAETIINAQPTHAEFNKIADIVIENNGTEAEFLKELQILHQKLLKQAQLYALS